MRAVFLKEWKQGYLLFVFGLAMTALVPLLYLLLSSMYPRDQRDVDTYLGWLYYLLPGVMALFAGSGLIASEVERGTLPVLLGLPISRGRIWLAKLLAGLSLGLASILVFVLPGAFSMPRALGEVDYGIFLPDLVIWLIVIFATAFFLSTACRRVISALMGSFLLSFACFLAMVLFVWLFGVRLLGYDEALDVELWMLMLVPALLAGSYLAFSRGGLLQSRRKWWLALAGLAIGFALTAAPVIALTRWETRYDRRKVESVSAQGFSSGGSAVCILTQGNPAPIGRESRTGWITQRDRKYRNQHVVFLDTKTGKELLVRRGDAGGAASRDGRFAAILTSPTPLTWRGGGEAIFPRFIETWDLVRHCRLYRGLPTQLGTVQRPGLGGVEWADDASRLLVWAWKPLHGLAGPGDLLLFVMRPDGGEPRTIEVSRFSMSYPPGNFALARDGHAVYTLEGGGRLLCHSLSTRATKKIWDGNPKGQLPSPYYWEKGEIALSPNGRLLAVFLAGVQPRRGPEGASWRLEAEAERKSPPKRVFLAFVVAADGSHSTAIYRAEAEAEHFPSWQAAWSRDSRSLYLYLTALESHFRFGPPRILRWREGETKAVLIDIIPLRVLRSLVPLPPPGELLLWGFDDAWLLMANDKLRPFPNERIRALARKGSILAGMDAQGRAILQRGQVLLAADLASGEVSQLYP